MTWTRLTCGCPQQGLPDYRCASCRYKWRWHLTTCREEEGRRVIEQRRDGRVVRRVCGDCVTAACRPSIPIRIRRSVIERDGMVCTLCGIGVVISTHHVPNRLHLDHIVQWAHGGRHDVENLRVTCADCNMGRSYRTDAA